MNDYDFGEASAPKIPYSLEAEQSVLGGIMLDSSKLEDVTEIVTFDDFFASHHKIMFAAMKKLSAEGVSIDAITLAEALEADGHLTPMGGIGYLVEIANNTPSAANILAYASIVADRSLERKIISAGQRICEIAYKALTVDEKLNLLHGELAKLERKDSSNNYEDFNATLKKVVQQIDAAFHGTITPGLLTGFTALDERFKGIKDGNFWVLAGRPGMGKTTAALNIANYVAANGKDVLIFSLEMGRDELVEKLLSAQSSLTTHTFRNAKTDMVDDAWPKLSTGVAKLKDLPIHIIDEGGLHVDRALAIARKFSRGGNLGLIVIDYLQLLTTGSEKRFDEVSQVSRALKVMAKNSGCPVIALSQLSRKCEERADKRPMASDLRESGQIEQDADIITFLYRDEVYHEDSPDKGITEAITVKFRNGQGGRDFLRSELQYNRFANFDSQAYAVERRERLEREAALPKRKGKGFQP